MDALGWDRVRLSGYSEPGRHGRKTGTHVRCHAYRGHLIRRFVRFGGEVHRGSWIVMPAQQR
jgi:hypothetical protein